MVVSPSFAIYRCSGAQFIITNQKNKLNSNNLHIRQLGDIIINKKENIDFIRLANIRPYHKAGRSGGNDGPTGSLLAQFTIFGIVGQDTAPRVLSDKAIYVGQYAPRRAVKGVKFTLQFPTLQAKLKNSQ